MSAETPHVAEPVSQTTRWGRVGFALRVLEVRFRFVLALALFVGCVAGWPWLKNLWDRARHQMAGHAPHAAVSTDTEFFCPMDPGVLSAWPAICPICNMDLVPRKKTDAVLLPEGVLARMQLSPYRIQLAGLRTAIVEPRAIAYPLTWSGTLRSEGATLFFEAPLAKEDEPLFARAWPAEVRPVLADQPVVAGTARKVAERSVVRFELANDSELPAGTPVIALVHVHAGDTGKTPESEAPRDPLVLAIPESAVVDRGADQVVYVENMPGMFDAVRVQVGRPSAGHVPVLAGLTAGQRVVTTGSFLVDAETRLDPGLAVQYFGASPQASAVPAPQVLQSAKLARKLSPADQRLADEQRVCPVTGLPLNSMGGPIAVEVAGRRVFLCCKGCEGALRADPQKYFAKLKASP